MTNNLIVTIFALSVMVSLAGVALYFAKPLINRYCSKRLQYYIWLILAIRLLIPLGVSIPVPSNLFSQSTSKNEVISNYEINDIDAYYKAEIEDISGITSSNTTASDENIPVYVELSKMPNLTLTTYDICLGVIFGVAIILLIGRVTVYLKFRRLLMHNAKPIEDDIMLDQFDFIKEKMGIKRKINLLFHDAIGSPMLIGILHPAIVLPTALVNSSAQVNIDYVFLHELMHFKNRDIIYKWLLQCVLCFHWFNPLAYLICSECNRLCELSCDEAVTQRLSHNEKRAYGDTLLRSMELADAYAYPAVALTLAENAKLIKERLGEIMKKTKKSRCAATLSVILASVIIFSTMITGVYAAPPMEHDAVIVKDYPVSTTVSALPNATAIPIEANPSKIINIDIKNPQPETNGLVFIDLGKRTLTQGQQLLAEVYWEGNGTLMFLYTKEKLDAPSVKKLIENGLLPFVSSNSHDISDTTNLKINLVNDSNLKLNFALDKSGFIGWLNDIPDSGEHNFYIIGLANAAIKNINGFISPNHNLTAGDKLHPITKWSSITQSTPTTQSSVISEGSVAPNLTGLGAPFVAIKGANVTIKLIEDLWGMGLDKDKIKLKILIGDSDAVTRREISLSNKDREFSFTALQSATHWVKIVNENMQSVNYKFEILTPALSSPGVSSQQTKQNIQKSNNIICEGGIAANLTGPASSNQLTVNKGDKITISLAEDLSGWGLVKESIKVTIIIDGQSVVLSNTDREKTIVANNGGTFTVKIKNSNMQLVNYKFNLTINK